MISPDVVRTVVGIIGNIISLCLFLSPVPTFIRICKKGSVEQYSPMPYLATFVNCGLWVLYGLPIVHPNSTLVITINGAGFIIEIVLLSLFLIYSDKKQRIKVVLVLVAEVVFLAVLAVLVLTFAHTTKLRSNIVGSMCMAANVMMYAAPLSVMKLVITTKSVEFMPFFLSLASFANGVCWTIYALIRIDPFIIAPNGTGALLCAAQLILYATYYKNTKKMLAERASKGELGLTENNKDENKKTKNEIQNGQA